MTKMPEALEFAANKILKDKPLYQEILSLLKKEMLKLHNDSLSHSTFCDILKTPANLHKELLKRFNLSDRQMMHAFEEIGFNPIHKQYSDLYYQTLSLVYYIGSKAEDDVMRIFATVLINVKMFNGRRYKYFPNGCQEEIAQYMLTSLLRSSAIFKKYPSPFIAISQYYAPYVDSTYKDQIRKEPAHPVNGLIKIVGQSWNRLEQTFLKTLQKPYYQVWNDSQKKLINLSGSDKQGQEIDRLDVSKVEKLVEKGLQNLVHKSNRFLPEDIAYFKAAPYKVSDKFIKHAEEFLNDSINEDDIQHTMEIILSILKVQDENKLCGMHIVFSSNKLSNTKVKNSEQDKLKKHIDELLQLLYPNLMTTISKSSALKARKILLLMIMLRIKRAFCNKAVLEK